MNKGLSLVGLLLILAVAFGSAQIGRAPQPADAYRLVRPEAAKWEPFLPGVQMAVLSGDPNKPGPYVVWIKSPDGYKLPPHWHPEDENLTVLKGTFLLGMGERFDTSRLRELPATSYGHMPKDMRHFALCKGETVVQIHGNGPFVIHYVNPADEPRNRKK